jgi:drug/metabolite transporter (DMT)-like permease
MNNMALVHSTTAFVEIVGASTPLVTVVMILVMRQPFDMKLLGPCFLVVIGCALTTNGEPHFSLLGLVLATGSNVPRSLKSVLQQVLMQGDSSALAYNPLDVLAWTCLPSSVVMLIWSIVQEGIAPYQQWYAQGVLSQLTAFVLVSCVNACILNLAILFVIKDLGAVGTQIVAQTKSILVILGGATFLKEEVTRLEVVGFILVMVGVYTYNDLESRVKAKAKEQASEKLDVAQPQLKAQVLEDSKVAESK